MNGKLRRLGGRRLLAMGLLVVMGLSVFGTYLVLRAPTASAASATVTYVYLAGAEPLCSLNPSFCPDVAMAANGDTITLTGGGTLSIHPDSVTGGGSYSGAGVGTGTWTAEQLLSFVSYGSASAQGLPPSFEGGQALVRIHLSSGLDGVLRITCGLGSPPPSAMEGIRLALQGGPNFNMEDGGNTLFIRTS